MHVHMNILDNINLADVTRDSVDRKDNHEETLRHFFQNYS